MSHLAMRVQAVKGKQGMYELIILAVAMTGPMHGYLVAKIINDIIGPFAKFSNGLLYPLLAKLEKEGFIVVDESLAGEQHNERRQRSFRITDAGRRRFHQLMMDTTTNPGDYQRIFWHKLSYLHYLEPTERLFLLDHYIHYCQTLIFHLTHEMEDLRYVNEREEHMTQEHLEATLRVMQHKLDLWKLELVNVQSWRQDEAARQMHKAPSPSVIEE